MNKVICFIIILFTHFITMQILNAKERIDKSIINRASAQEVYVTFGRSTVIVLPCAISSFSDGPTNDIQALVNERNSKMIEVWFAKNSPDPQELKVFCNDQNYVFDIVPSKKLHQSIFEVDKSYKSIPVQIARSTKSDVKKNIKVIRVIKSSQDFEENTP